MNLEKCNIDERGIILLSSALSQLLNLHSLKLLLEGSKIDEKGTV